MFGEDLHLLRRIEADVGGNEIRIRDRVVNRGFARTPHMFFYHVNLGWPLVDEGARFVAPIREVLWASHAAAYRDQGVGYRTLPARAPASASRSGSTTSLPTPTAAPPRPWSTTGSGSASRW